MKVILAKSAGFCWGVRRAIDKARKLAAAAPGTLYTDGPLIHNRQMMDALKADGILPCDQPGNLNDCTLLIRAHGIAPERRMMLNRLPVQLQDATCPDVARIQSAIKVRAAKDVMVVIYGDKGHPEVTGLLGFAGERGRIISDMKDIARLPDHTPVTLVSQSTQFPLAFKKIAEDLLKRFPDAEILDTICPATRQRQQEVIELAGKVDIMVVVGGSHSANTQRLVKLAKTLGPTLHVETAQQIHAEDFAGYHTAGLTGGASTPDFILNDVRAKIEALD